MRAVRENRDYGSAVRVRYKRLLKMRIRFSPFRGCGTGEPSLTFPGSSVYLTSGRGFLFRPPLHLR